jgi:hypothetical protein
MMVAGTAAAVGMALTNGRRLTPVFVERPPGGSDLMLLPYPRTFFARRFALATLLAALGVLAVATIAGVATVIVQQVAAG